MYRFSILVLSAICFIFSCHHNSDLPTAEASLSTQDVEQSLSEDFRKYWYNGTAEVSSYGLVQDRYGESRPGDAVLIFVTEPFSIKKQVKLDYPDQASRDRISVLKLNQVRKLNTGISDYSTMTSTFTPVEVKDHPRTIRQIYV